MASRSAQEASFAGTMVSCAAVTGRTVACLSLPMRWTVPSVPDDWLPGCGGCGARDESHRPGAACPGDHPEQSRHHRAAAGRQARSHRASRPAIRRHLARGGPADRVGQRPLLRLPPLTFTAAEAMGLVMAVLEGHPNAADPGDLVGSALAKIVRVLPEPVAGPVRALRAAAAPAPSDGSPVSPELTARLIESCTAARRLRLVYRMAADHVMEVDPWAVVLWHSRWYLLCWSHARAARRVLRVDRIVTAEVLPDTFTPPAGLDALGALEEQLSQGRTYPVDVLLDATVEETSRWLPRSLGRLVPDEAGRTRLRASTDEPGWYAGRLAAIPMPFRVLASPELRAATAALGRRLLAAGDREPGYTREGAEIGREPS